MAYVSSDGAYGGPVAVAIAQTRELARLGHEVHLVAGWDGLIELDVRDVTVHLFPTQRVAPGLTGLISPQLWAYLMHTSPRFDVIHLHLGRDLILLGAAIGALRARTIVAQTHGMVSPDTRLRARLVDMFIVRPLLLRAKVLALTLDEAEALRIVARQQINVRLLKNGIHVAKRVDLSRQQPPQVTFLARLHPRKNVLVFAQAAALLRHHPLAPKFCVIGPDEGDLERLQSFVREENLSSILKYEGVIPPGNSAPTLCRTAIFVLPSHREVYPVTVLEALAVGTPVVLSEECGLAPELRAAGAAVIVHPDAISVATAIEQLLDPEFRVTQAARGHIYALKNLNIEQIASTLVEIYSR